MQRVPFVSNNFYRLTAISMASALFVAGRFGFTDILGTKRLLEAVLFVPIGLFGLILIFLAPRIWMRSFFLLPLSYFIFQFFNVNDALILADLTMSVLFVGIINALGSDFADLLLRYVIIIAFTFALLGIIEFFILLFKPNLISYILLFYDNYSGSSHPVIQNVLQLLGLADGTSYHLFGMSVTRLRSFASEPSLLVGYFLIPGALGLTYRNGFATLGKVCIFFCVLSLAGSVYSSLCAACGAIFLVVVKRKYLATILPFILLIIFIWILFSHFTELILLVKQSGNSYDFLDKTNSATMRFSYIRDFIPKVLASPLGIPEKLQQPLGLLIGSAARAGVIGFAIAIIVLINIYNAIDKLILRKDLYPLQILGILIIYGSITMGVLYLDNCFIQLYGFTLLMLTYCRLINMRGRLEHA